MSFHTTLQNHLQSLFPQDLCLKEVRFPSIARVADLFVPHKKWVFEIQHSPILKNELLNRTLDYKSLGFTVIWILDDTTFIKGSAIVTALTRYPFFFSNMSKEIYTVVEGRKTIVDITKKVHYRFYKAALKRTYKRLKKNLYALYLFFLYRATS